MWALPEGIGDGQLGQDTRGQAEVDADGEHVATADAAPRCR